MGTGNGQTDIRTLLRASPVMQEAKDRAETLDTLEQERELSPIVTEYPCPDMLWQGRLAQIADRLGKRSWEVWLGAICAMGAVAQKNLHWHYYRPLYGMLYGLLISPTGKGKGVVADVCKALLPEGYTVRGTVQSGQALFPILAEVTKNTKGKIVSIQPRPAILVIEEWSALLKASKMEFSQLQDTLNALFHQTDPFYINRSDAERSGGDRSVDNPTLSICATTVEKLLRQHVTPNMVSSGFLNRYLVVPGSSDQWKLYDPDKAGINANLVKGFLDDLIGYAWGASQNVWLAYSEEARERFVSWGTPVLEPIMNSQSLEAESLRRLHVYAHMICLLYAWSEKLPLVTLRHVEAAIVACEVSKLFVESLMSDDVGDIPLPQYKQWEVSLEHKILAKVNREPGITSRKIARDLARDGTYKDRTQAVRSLIQLEKLLTIKDGKIEHLFINNNNE